MTPDERDLLTRFLQDLAQTRTTSKDAQAADMITRTLDGNSDAQYLLVQHAILADQALHAAQARISELENGSRAGPAPSFLGSGGGGPWGQPSAPPPNAAQPAYAAPDAYPRGPFSSAPSGGGFGSFLRGAATTAAGVAGGEMLFSGLSGLFGGHHGMFGGGYGGYGGGENVTVNNYYDDNDSDDRSSDDYSDDGGGWNDQ